jgi:DNA polymerase-3 subunit beta
MPPEQEGRWYVFVLDEGRELWQVRKTDGRYPNWRQLMPDSYELEADLPRDELVSAVEAARVIAERNSPMRLVVNGNVKATVVQPDTAQFEETIAGASVVYLTDAARDLHAGDGVEYGYNPDFLADCAKTLGANGSAIRVRMITPLRPVLMDADGDRALLMPIRINV